MEETEVGCRKESWHQKVIKNIFRKESWHQKSSKVFVVKNPGIKKSSKDLSSHINTTTVIAKSITKITHRVVSCLLYVKASEDTEVNRLRDRSLKYFFGLKNDDDDDENIRLRLGANITQKLTMMMMMMMRTHILLRLGAPLKANGGISSMRFRSSRLQ